MAYSTISKSTSFFNTKLYTGNSSTQAITGIGFQPDFVWTKPRVTGGHFLSNSIRGGTKIVQSAETAAEATRANHIQSFDSDGYTLGADGTSNSNGDATVSWNWKANGTGSSNTDGTITSTVSANTTSGFSIVLYTGNNNNAQTIGHGLGSAPEVIFIKRLGTYVSGTADWVVYHEKIGASKHMHLNTNALEASDNGMFNGTSPTSSVFTVHAGDDVNKNGDQFIAYCFTSKTGYSRFGDYYGTGGSGFGNNYRFIYTGFKPTFFLVKNSDANGDWNIWDSTRSTFNSDMKQIYANSNDAEGNTSGYWDFLSNGIKQRHSGFNDNNDRYVYMAFGQSLVGSNNVPCTAR
tara:strand:+ start:37 stop:1083 length:1047 start_codon:yes stop_codon:yes gene_type:complete